ncbi:MAG TPA: glycoside hydrolase family 2 protein [Phycisphaerae bacterium]|nr:glycoside hydrolase family 2 protein [Phycisphaerae bacterium]HOB76501.1 glycoside hydrolase family 2 protein [Phycisphaerae bacterium]HOJ56055.1 glycoside hydrolase family 2 protein [Phycisphaerae bacterium]HOL28315.1 glycoside hydrolase family 2 protein [Phycisphaerae bacterium]HPP22789.1 glycoside hydrolase family 2 protein [Phycisphaerae bacterium]
MMREIDLNGSWEFRQAGRAPLRIKRWLPATVPGTVHTDLLAAGQIEDPFYRTNELDLRWIEQADWVYRRTVHLKPEFLRDARAVWLDFAGLDTLATVRLNGHVVGQADNMFHPWRFDVRPFLKTGANQLEVEFASAPRVAEELAAKSRNQYRSVFYQPRLWLRKAQYAGGWDWGPRFLTCGIWRPVCLRAVEQAEICNVHAFTTELNQHRAVLAVDVEIESHVSASAAVCVSLRPADGASGASQAASVQPAAATSPSGKPVRNGRVSEVRVEADLAHGTQIVSTSLIVENPALWWPNGMGSQSLYEVEVVLEMGAATVHAVSQTVGFRSVELIRERDGQGESFRFRVNGRDVFCKGANWIPGDSFLPRFTPERYRQRLLDARDTHMNMLRVWGGGVYEDPAFYRLCDELGLMVWQDFMFACSEYPEEPALVEKVRREARHVVRELRNHPCLVLWCGNNENQWLFDEIWAPTGKRSGETYYNDILPAVCREYDPQRPYWPGSPYGGSKANDPNFGDCHVWSVWGGWLGPAHYRDNPARFASEFGFQAMPAAATVREFTAREDRRLFSPVIDHHNKVEDGHARIVRFLADSLGLPVDLDDYVYLSQVQQADAIKIGVEHWRRRWPGSAGALYWQLNDCWPVASWSAVDWAGRPKALWYASRRFFSPALVSFCPVSNTPFGLTDLDLWVTWDGLDYPSVRLDVTAMALDGKILKKRRFETRLPANGSRRVATLQPRVLGLSRPEYELVHVRMSRGKETLSENFHYFAPGKYMDWPDPGIRVAVRRGEAGLKIELTARCPARAVCLTAERWEGRFSDNFFDLMPGETRAIDWLPAGRPPAPKTFAAGLSVRSFRRGPAR